MTRGPTRSGTEVEAWRLRRGNAEAATAGTERNGGRAGYPAGGRTSCARACDRGRGENKRGECGDDEPLRINDGTEGKLLFPRDSRRAGGGTTVSVSRGRSATGEWRARLWTDVRRSKLDLAFHSRAIVSLDVSRQPRGASHHLADVDGCWRQLLGLDKGHPLFYFIFRNMSRALLTLSLLFFPTIHLVEESSPDHYEDSLIPQLY